MVESHENPRQISSAGAILPQQWLSGTAFDGQGCGWLLPGQVMWKAAAYSLDMGIPKMIEK